MYARRRESTGRSAYSSADAYRALGGSGPSSNSHSGHGHADSSEDESQLQRYTTSPVGENAATRGPADARGSTSLSPPRPKFAVAENRASWSSENNSSVAGEQSDSDGVPPPVPGKGADRSVRAVPRGSYARARQEAAASSQPISPTNPRIRARNHRRRSSMAQEYAPVEAEEVASPTSHAMSPTGGQAPNPFDTPTNSFYGAVPGSPTSPASGRAPPSAFPFLSHPGNPDPGTHIPGMGRRSSVESLRARETAHRTPISPNYTGTAYPAGGTAAGYGLVAHDNASAGDLGRPYAPFMENGGLPSREGSATPPSPLGSQSALYMSSAAAAMNGSQTHIQGVATIPRSQSSPALNMRAPFLSPASRPSSTLWSPPAFPFPYPPAQSTSSNSGFAVRKTKPLMPSSRLSQKLSKEDKPWLKKRDCRDRASWWLTFFCLFVGIGGAAVLCFFGWTSVLLLKDSDLCLVLEDNFDTLNLNTWTRDVELGGFGNGEFQMTTNSDKNLFVQDGQLYILPTLTSDEIGLDKITDGGQYTLDGCTSNNKSACSVSSNAGNHQAIQPVQSARLHTANSATIAYGKVEVRAKIPRGDWLWPAIWMLPKDNKYGPWPLSGEIDLMESRGNDPSYPAQGRNVVRGSLNYGPLASLPTQLFGFISQKQSSYDKDFHVYALEWTPDWMRFYVDSRLKATMNLKITGKGGKDFFKRGNYPETSTNGSNVAVVVENIWAEAGGSAAAPFDQQFYLILDVAAGGTSGWFPDSVGGKPWFDGSNTAMFDFAKAQSTWSATWPSDSADRAMRIDYVKMWKLGSC